MSYKGKYQPKNTKKYVGNHSNIIYRSLWERKFMIYCDTNENILEWGSEELVIPYRSPVDGKIHRYFPDFYIKVKEPDGNIKKYLIEIKPHKQTMPPKKPQRQTKGYIYEAYEYAKNQSKWEAAKEYCKDRQWEFKVLTENELGIK
jgi:TnsA endonuclease N terminal